MNIYDVMSYSLRSAPTWRPGFIKQAAAASALKPAQPHDLVAERLEAYAQRLEGIEQSLQALEGKIQLGFWNSGWGGATRGFVPGAAAGAGTGLFFGGPIGAALGGVIGGVGSAIAGASGSSGSKELVQAQQILQYQRKTLESARHYIRTYAAALRKDPAAMREAYQNAQLAEQEARKLGATLPYRTSSTWMSSLGEMLGQTTKGYEVLSLLDPQSRAAYETAVRNIQSAFADLKTDLDNPVAQSLGSALDNLKKYTGAFAEATSAPAWNLFEPGKYSPPALPTEDLNGAELAIKSMRSTRSRTSGAPVASGDSDRLAAGTAPSSSSSSSLPPQLLAAMFGIPVGMPFGPSPAPSAGGGLPGQSGPLFGGSSPFAGSSSGTAPFRFA